MYGNNVQTEYNTNQLYLLFAFIVEVKNCSILSFQAIRHFFDAYRPQHFPSSIIHLICFFYDFFSFDMTISLRNIRSLEFK